MVFRLFKRRRWTDAADAVYAGVVRQARRPEFYTRLGVADTVDGRFDLIVLHAALVIRRLTAEGGSGPEVAQAVFDRMFVDMDRSLREMGVGDLSVGKHVKGMAKAFYGRAAAYEQGLAEGRAVLEGALRRNLYRKMEPSDAQVAALAAYIEAQAEAVGRQPFERILQGAPGFTEAAPDGALADADASGPTDDQTADEQRTDA